MAWITRLDRLLVRIEEILLALILVGMVGLAALQVLLRNIWDTGIDWADLTAQNATVLLGFLGAAVATSEGRHLNIDILSRVLKGRAQMLLKVLINGFAVTLCILATQGGWLTFRVNLDPWTEMIPQGFTLLGYLRQQFFEGEIPMWVSVLILPFGFGLMGFHFLLRFVRDLGTLITGREWENTALEGPTGDALLDEMERQADGGPR